MKPMRRQERGRENSVCWFFFLEKEEGFYADGLRKREASQEGPL